LSDATPSDFSFGHQFLCMVVLRCTMPRFHVHVADPHGAFLIDANLVNNGNPQETPLSVKTDGGTQRHSHSTTPCGRTRTLLIL
jgi:hypothetical protein